MIEVHNITKSFGDLKALSDISFCIDKGTVVGFLGANGAGKTTTMDIICGFLGADAGTVKIGGFDIFTHPIDAKARIGYLPDNPPLYLDIKVKSAIEFSAKLHKVSKKDLKQFIDEAIRKLDLESVQDRVVGNLSKGFKQRVAFAQAIVHKPDVLVLDEPTEGLDPNQIVQMRELIISLKGDHTIILSSHILSEVENICDRIIILHQGKIAKEGTYEELINEFERENHFILKLDYVSQDFLDQLSKLDGIKATKIVENNGSSIDIIANSEFKYLPEKIVKIAFEHKLEFREFVCKTRKLEDVFFKVTH